MTCFHISVVIHFIDEIMTSFFSFFRIRKKYIINKNSNFFVQPEEEPTFRRPDSTFLPPTRPSSIYIDPQLYEENKHWRKETVIGVGMFGECFQALDVLTGTLMAVKRVKVPVGETHVNREDLKAEIELLGSLKHENIVHILGATEEQSYFNIFLEWMPGGSISGLLSKFGPFHEMVIIKYTRQVLTGLAYLHSNKILHRDLKGANILVDGTGQQIRITDFGTAACLKTQVTVEGELKGQVIGTLPFMAPEVVRGDNYGRSSDIWSVGCVIIEMATARMPWQDSSKPQLTNYFQFLYMIAQTTQPPPIPAYLTSSTRSLIEKCVKLNPELRPTATELLQNPCFSNRNSNTDLAKLSISDMYRQSNGLYHFRGSFDGPVNKDDGCSVDSGSYDYPSTSSVEQDDSEDDASDDNPTDDDDEQVGNCHVHGDYGTEDEEQEQCNMVDDDDEKEDSGGSFDNGTYENQSEENCHQEVENHRFDIQDANI